MILKSFNFKLYYTEGGQTLAKQIISEAESGLETMENFLGTRLVEQIDIFLSEKPISDEYTMSQRNGNIFLDNSSIYLYYCGNTKSVVINLKERLAEILINGMLYGNTIKERLKNNREINVPNWYVSGLAKYVAGGNEPNTSWMADYYEGKLQLNLNLTDKNELAEFGHAVFIHINDSFGINKLRQLLFYTKLSGKTDYAFLYVLGKSVNWVIADWFKMERLKYLKENNKRLPNDPEPIAAKLQTADIIEIKFTKDGNQLDLLIRTLDGVEIWNYDIGSRKTLKVIRMLSVNKKNIWSFVKSDDIYYLTKSNGSKSSLILIENSKIERTVNLDFNYILAIKEHPVSGLAILAQKKYRMDVFQLVINETPQLVNMTNNLLEETDFAFDKNGSLYLTIFSNKRFSIQKNNTETLIYSSFNPILRLNSYKENYLSYIQTAPDKNVGRVVNTDDSSQTFQVTNYTRSIFNYDFNNVTKKVMEGLRYGKKNYLVISEASFDKVLPAATDTIVKLIGDTLKIGDTINTGSTYKFITGFEYKINKLISPEPQTIKEYKTQLKIKELAAPQYEFKPSSIRFGFSNSQFNSPLFANFFPINQGINNGPNIIAGCRITDIYKKYSIAANIRQPLSGKGTDMDFMIRASVEKFSYGILMYNSIFQPEPYNQESRYTTKEIKFFLNVKLHPRLTSVLQAGYREDELWPLSVSVENLQLSTTKLQQPFLQSTIDYNILNITRLNYSQKLTTLFSFNIFKPFNKSGVMTNLFFNARHDQSFFRVFHLSTRFSIQSSVGKQKTVWLLGGVSNWLRPVIARAAVYYTDKIEMYSSMNDFAGLPYNYKAGSSAGIAKIILSMPVNPVLSQQNFNQIFFKFLTLRSFVNAGTAWFGRNPFSIENPDNKEIIETGSMTIINYVAKNPIVWSLGAGANSILFGYEVGFDYSVGYGERGSIGKFTYLTVGKEF